MIGDGIDTGESFDGDPDEPIPEPIEPEGPPAYADPAEDLTGAQAGQGSDVRTGDLSEFESEDEPGDSPDAQFIEATSRLERFIKDKSSRDEQLRQVGEGAEAEHALDEAEQAADQAQQKQQLSRTSSEDVAHNVTPDSDEAEINERDTQEPTVRHERARAESDAIARARQQVRAAFERAEPDSTEQTDTTRLENTRAEEDNETGRGASTVRDDAKQPEQPAHREVTSDRDPAADSEQGRGQDPADKREIHEYLRRAILQVNETERQFRTEADRELLRRGTFLTAAEASRQLEVPTYYTNKFPAEAAADGILLARRIEDEAGPSEMANFSYSKRYIAAVADYKAKEEIVSAADAAQEVASEAWGQFLAWGIRAEYQDAIRAYGEFMRMDEAIEATQISRSTLVKRGLIEDVPMPDGKLVRVVPTDQLLAREYWVHRGFQQLSRQPEPVTFYGTREVADMLHQKAAATIRKLLYQHLLPGVVVEAPVRRDPERQQRNFYARIPSPDADALGKYWEGNQRKTLRAVVRGFIEDNPTQYTTTRGRFEAHVHMLRQRGELRHKTEVERLLGASGSFFEYYARITGEEALRSLHWNRILPPADRRVSEVDARTVRAAVQDVIERQKHPAEVAAEYGVSKRTVYNWLKAASQGRL